MKETKVIKRLITFMLICIFCLGINTKIFAANNTTSKDSTETTNTSSENTTKTSTKAESSNANLSNLGINPNDFKGFKKDTITYDVSVPETVTVVEVYAKAEDSKATISGTGSKSLAKGKNTIPVVVIAEDGTKKTYTINLTRGEATANTEESTSEDGVPVSGLAELTIENVTLNPTFSVDVYEYTAKYIGEETKLNITAKATDAYCTTEVTGNEDLKEGENLITILVTDPDGENVATYQITLNKSLVDEEAIAKENQEKEDKKKKLIIICSCVVLGVLIIIGGAILIHKRRARFDEEYYDDDDYYDNDVDEDDYYEAPKAFKKPIKRNIQDDEDENIKENINQEAKNEDLDGIKIQEPVSKKDELKKQFLDNYNNDYYEDEPRKRKSKGKRFK